VVTSTMTVTPTTTMSLSGASETAAPPTDGAPKVTSPLYPAGNDSGSGATGSGNGTWAATMTRDPMAPSMSPGLQGTGGSVFGNGAMGFEGVRGGLMVVGAVVVLLV
jgi:hypothetical protein